MARTESHSNGMEKTSLSNLTPVGLAALGEKTMEEFAKAQASIFSTLHGTHRRWLDHMRSDARFASEFAERVTSARSIPDAMAACREWTSRRFEMMAEEGNHLLAESRKVVETGARFLSEGAFVTNEPGVVTGAGGDRMAGDRQRGYTLDPNPRNGSVSSQPASMHSGRSEEVQAGRSRPSGDTASL
jgi:hypothetical protein